MYSAEQSGRGRSPTHGPERQSPSHPPRGACRRDGSGNRHFRRRRKLRRVRTRRGDGVYGLCRAGLLGGPCKWKGVGAGVSAGLGPRRSPVTSSASTRSRPSAGISEPATVTPTPPVTSSSPRAQRPRKPRRSRGDDRHPQGPRRGVLADHAAAHGAGSERRRQAQSGGRKGRAVRLGSGDGNAGGRLGRGPGHRPGFAQGAGLPRCMIRLVSNCAGPTAVYHRRLASLSVMRRRSARRLQAPAFGRGGKLLCRGVGGAAYRRLGGCLPPPRYRARPRIFAEGDELLVEPGPDVRKKGEGNKLRERCGIQ